MIGEIINAEYHISQVSNRKFIRCVIEVDGSLSDAFISLDTISANPHHGSNAVYLICAICSITWPTPEQLIKKLVPMTPITFRGKTFWSFNWKQMNRIEKQLKKEKHERNYKTN